MKIQVVEGKETLLSVSGQIDALNMNEFEEVVRGILSSESRSVVFDCNGLTYVSSAGLRILLTLQKGMSAKQGELRLRHVCADVMEVFEVTGFSSFLTIE